MYACIHPIRWYFSLTFFFLFTNPSHPCTIFVLTDANQALFFNNEDWSNPKTRIWFVSPGEHYFGCAYVGFDNGWAQGGLNTECLAFDWVAGFMEKWEPVAGMRNVRGNPSNQMLETCTNVDDAIQFYQNHWEPSFSYAKILVADKSGASVIIGAKEGKLQVERSNQSRGFGYGRDTLEKRLAQHPKVTIAEGTGILWACLQDGQYPTQYSNAFDLKAGGIFLYLKPKQDEEVRLSLVDELHKGDHYYDIPKIREQLAQAPQPLLKNMKRFLLDEYKAIPDPEPGITEHLRSLIEDAMKGKLHPEDYTSELWEELSHQQKEIQEELKALGEFASITLVERREDDNLRNLLYRVEYTNAVVLQYFVLDKQNKIVTSRSEGAELKTRGVD